MNSHSPIKACNEFSLQLYVLTCNFLNTILWAKPMRDNKRIEVVWCIISNIYRIVFNLDKHLRCLWVFCASTRYHKWYLFTFPYRLSHIDQFTNDFPWSKHDGHLISFLIAVVVCTKAHATFGSKGPLWWEFIGKQWISLTNISNAKPFPSHDVVIIYKWPATTDNNAAFSGNIPEKMTNLINVFWRYVYCIPISIYYFVNICMEIAWEIHGTVMTAKTSKQILWDVFRHILQTIQYGKVTNIYIYMNLKVKLGIKDPSFGKDRIDL